MTAAPAGGWRVAAARHRGESHARRGEAGQDALRLSFCGDVLVAAVADGAGSAPRGGAGAALAVRAAAGAALAALRDGLALADATEADIAAWLQAARASVAGAAARSGVPARDCAATLALAASDGRRTLIGHVGDGAVVGRCAQAGWRALSWPDAGAHAGETRFLTEDPPALRATVWDEPLDALALLTDGLERVALDFATQTAHGPFFERMTAPLRALPRPGRDARLSHALGRWLGGAAVAARTDDDRTLVLCALERR